jgi:PAS domain S-box-containing protein
VDLSERKQAEATLQAQAAELQQTEQAAQRLASIVESSDDAIASKDLNGIIRTWNRGAERLFGYMSHEVVGKPVTILIPEDHLDEEPEILRRIRRGERVEHYETRRVRKDGSIVDVSLSVSPVRDKSGKVVGASKIARDISERKRAEEALARRMAEQSALYRFTERLHRTPGLNGACDAALDAIREALGCERAAVLLFDEGKVMRFVESRGLSEGYRNAVEGHSPWTPDSIDPRPVLIEDVARADFPAALQAAVRSEGIAALAFVPVVTGGRLIGKFMAYYDAIHAFSEAETHIALTIARQLGVCIERLHSEQARLAAEAQRELLVAELSHRVKNTLATVVSIARQSFSTNPDAMEAQLSFNARIRALGQTHSRLAEANWSGVSLGTVLLDELAPYRREDGANIRLDGPPVTLDPKQALTVAMAVHELATNAAKYGALSTATGKVDVGWLVDEPSRRLEIRWAESGGPDVVAPTRSGFGRLLIERVLTSDLGGNVQMSFAEPGVVCEITIPFGQPPR